MAAVSAQAVGEIVQSIFSTMMDLEVTVAGEPLALTGDRLTCSVYLEGASNGAVSLQCNRRQACEFAGRFLATDPPKDVDDDVRDVVGEIANMIGGNMKSTMGTDVRLSIPSVIDGSDYEIRVCGSTIHEVIGFRFSGGDFWVTVLGKDSTGGSMTEAAICTSQSCE